MGEGSGELRLLRSEHWRGCESRRRGRARGKADKTVVMGDCVLTKSIEAADPRRGFLAKGGLVEPMGCEAVHGDERS